MRWCFGLLVLVALGPLAQTLAPAQADGEAPVDYEFFKERVWPQLQTLCAECHADPRKRSKMGRFFLRPLPGRTVRERHHEDNFEEVLKFIEPGNPAASALLLKAIGPDRGGVTHEGGAIVDPNDAAYGAIIDFINGTALPRRSWRPPLTPDGEPDFLYYLQQVAPVLGSVCAECHAMPGKGRMKLVVPPSPASELTLEDQFTNYEMVLRLVMAGQPAKSRFLVKPLAVADGGFKHKGGDLIRKDDVNYVRWVEFITGTRGPALPASGRPSIPVLTAQGLRLQAEDLRAEGDLSEIDAKDAEQYVAVMAGPGGGELDVVLDVQDAGTYLLTVRAVPGERPLQIQLSDGPTLELQALAGALETAPYQRLGPQGLQDGDAPLLAPRGGLRLEKDILHMDGREGGATFLSPTEIRHSGVSAKVHVLPEEEGGDDIRLLFDMQDADNGKFMGLIDGGRRVVLGVIEGGTPRVLAATKAPEPKSEDAGKPRELKVEYFGGLVVGSLDGKPLLSLNLDRQLGEGLFGMATHGRAQVHALAALEEYEVYRVALAAGSVIDLPRGRVRLVLSCPPGAGPIDALDLRTR